MYLFFYFSLEFLNTNNGLEKKIWPIAVNIDILIKTFDSYVLLLNIKWLINFVFYKNHD